MSSTTGDHINELEARRKRRQGRQAAGASDEKPPRRSNSAGAARELWRDVIAEGPSRSEHAPIPSDTHSSSASQTNTEQTTGTPNATERLQRQTGHNGEGVDELVRRVQAGRETTAASAETAARNRRPTGTANLSADAASRSGPPRRARHRPTRPASQTAKSRHIALGGLLPPPCPPPASSS